MIKNKKILAIIPARKKSEELKNKNLKKFKGKPLVLWTLEAAKKSKYIDKVIVSSNSKKILKISEKYKNFILSKRPENLSTKNAEIKDVVAYEIKKFKNYDIVVLLQPTSPLRTSKHIDQSLLSMIKSNKKSCVSFISIKYNPQNFYIIKKNRNIKPFSSRKTVTTNRYKYKKFFYPSGDVYISYVNRFLDKKNFIDNDTLPFIMNYINSSDIDNYFDFKTAELKFSLGK